jgi:mannosyl-oligosaccharide alpha-1,2-mannosidase
MNSRFSADGARRQKIRRTRDRYALAPDDPLPDQLPSPNVIFPNITTSHLSYPAAHQRFPREDLHKLYPAGPPDIKPGYEEVIDTPSTPMHPFIRNWTSPQWFDPGGKNARQMPKVQHDFTKESVPKGRRKVNEERAEAVKRAFVHAWQQYKDHAWGEYFLL